MNYILKKIEKKIYINYIKNNFYFFIFKKKLIFLVNILDFKIDIKNILKKKLNISIIKKYLIESGLIKINK